MSMESKQLETQYKGKALEAANLPALPVVLQEAMNYMSGTKTNMTKVGSIISRDQVLSAKVLKMVNSPVYGFPGRISSIQNALVLLGFNVIRSLIISTVVFENMSTVMRGLWTHSMACSTACREIVVGLRLKNVEEFTLAGLLHDFGKVITATQMPEAQKDIEALIASEDVLYYEAEKKLLGFGHQHINSWVADHWMLPSSLKAAMSWHHAPMNAGTHKTLVCVVHLADFMVRLFETGSGGDDNVPLLDPMALKHLDIDQATLGDLVDKIGEALASAPDSSTFA